MYAMMTFEAPEKKASPFSTIFPTLSHRNCSILATMELSSAIAFNLDKATILSSSKGVLWYIIVSAHQQSQFPTENLLYQVWLPGSFPPFPPETNHLVHLPLKSDTPASWLSEARLLTKIMKS